MNTVVRNGHKQLWLVLFLIIFILTSFKLIFNDVTIDFSMYYESVHSSLEGVHERGYMNKGFTYMPFSYLILHVYGLLSLKAARLLHHIVEAGSLMLACFMLLELALEKEEYIPYLMGATLLLSIRFILYNFNYGQMNVVILSSIVAGLYFFHKKKDMLAALFMVIAISFKLTPVIFILYFLLKKEFRLVLWTIIMLALLNFILPLFFWGIKEAIGVYSAWYSSLFTLGNIYAAKVTNYSLMSLLYRFFTDLSWGEKYVPVNIAALPYGFVTAAYALCAAISLFVFIILFGRPAKQLEADNPGKNLFTVMLPEYSAVVILMLLFSPISWQHHFVLLLLPNYYIVYFFLKHGIKKNMPVFVPAVLAFIMIDLSARFITGKVLCRILMNNSVITFGAVFLLIAVFASALDIKERE